MPREFNRGSRVADQIQRDLAVLIQQEIKDPRLTLVTINEAKVSRDLSYADIYFTLLPDTAAEEAEGLLQESKIDKRWVRIKRPTVVVGGELTMAQLELQYNSSNGTNEAPIQLKSNCGTLVIDDFGRQKMSTDELLNRWIVPLESRHDFLTLPTGKKIEVPFEQLVIFSTNIQPRDLVDEAFLRRIPYKIEITDPAVSEFYDLFELTALGMGVEYRKEVVTYLIENFYRARKLAMRRCHLRDLMLQVKNYCRYRKMPLEMKAEYFDIVATTYFAEVFNVSSI